MKFRAEAKAWQVAIYHQQQWKEVRNGKKLFLENFQKIEKYF
jgi:hypothetical protein